MVKKFKKVNGITLISLVITIVIMLILAAVAISLVIGKNGLFTKAKASVDISEKRSAEEKVNLILGEYSMNQVDTDKDLDTFFNEKVSDNEIDSFKNTNDGKYTIKVDGYNVVIKKDDLSIESSDKAVEVKYPRDDLKVGDYINYDLKVITGLTYSKDKLTEDITGSTQNTQDIKQDKLKWKILRKYDDGRIDLIGSPTSQNIHLEKVLGYNNGVYVVNDICKYLYSNPEKGITARSVNIKDFEYWLKKSEGGVAARNAYKGLAGVKYNDTKQYVDARSYKPDIYGNAADDSDDYYEEPTTATYSGGKTGDTLDIKQTYYNLDINITNYGEGADVLSSDIMYWLGSRCVDCNTTTASFGLRYAITSFTSQYYYMFLSSYGTYGASCALRPVVTISADTNIIACEGNNSLTNMDQIEY